MIRSPLETRKTLLSGFVLTAVLAVLISGCPLIPVVDNGKQHKDFTVDKNVTYTPQGWPQALQADVYVPRKDKASFPAVVVVHGGGWQSGNRKQEASIARRLANAGMVAMNIDYRLAPEFQFPAQLYDVQQAVRWLRKNHFEYHVDNQHVGAYGYSAGAHLVALQGTVIAGDSLDSPYGGSQTRLQAIAAGGTPTDLCKLDLPQYLPDFLGGTCQEKPQRYAQASPIVHVRASAPPFFLFHGESDTLIPISQAEDFVKKLKSFGVHAELDRRPLTHLEAATSQKTARAATEFFSRELK